VTGFQRQLVLVPQRWWRGNPGLALLAGLCLIAVFAVRWLWPNAPWTPGPTGPVRLERTITVSAFGDWLAPIVFSRDGRTIAAMGDEKAYLYNLTTGRRARIWTNPDTVHDKPTELAFTLDGKALLISNSGELSAYLWNIATGTVAATFPDPPNTSIDDTALSPDGTLLAEEANWAGTTYLWNTVTRHYAGVLNDPGFGAESLAFSPDGAILAVGDSWVVGPSRQHGWVALWNVASRKISASYRLPHHADVQSVSFSPEGTLLAAASIHHTYLWDVTTGQLIQTLSGPRGSVIRQIAFSPDGRMLAAVSTSTAACIWDLATGKIVATMPDPSNAEIASIAYSPDGKTLAVGDFHSHIFLWNVIQTDRQPKA